MGNAAANNVSQSTRTSRNTYIIIETKVTKLTILSSLE